VVQLLLMARMVRTSLARTSDTRSLRCVEGHRFPLPPLPGPSPAHPTIIRCPMLPPQVVPFLTVEECFRLLFLDRRFNAFLCSHPHTWRALYARLCATSGEGARFAVEVAALAEQRLHPHREVRGAVGVGRLGSRWQDLTSRWETVAPPTPPANAFVRACMTARIHPTMHPCIHPSSNQPRTR
jgi:hypothetical protein